MSKPIISDIVDNYLAKTPYVPVPEVTWEVLLKQVKEIEAMKAKFPQPEIKGRRKTLDTWLTRLRPDIEDMPAVTQMFGQIPIVVDERVPEGYVVLADMNPKTAKATVFWKVEDDA